jgi:hypothetical protein
MGCNGLVIGSLDVELPLRQATLDPVRHSLIRRDESSGRTYYGAVDEPVRRYGHF